MMVWRDRGIASTAASLPLLLCCCGLLVSAVLADTEYGPAQDDGVAMSRLSKRSAFVFPSDDDDDTYIPDRESISRNEKTSSFLDEDQQSQRSRSSSGKKISFPVDEEQQEVRVPAAGTGRTSNGRGFFSRSGTVNGDGASGSSDQLIRTLSSLVSLLPRDQKNAAAAAAVDTNTRQAVDGFRLSDLMPDGLSALEGLDDLLRSTVPRVDRFNCLERVMCEMAAPLGIGGGDGGNFLEDGVQTLQQISNSPLLQQFPDRFLQEGSEQQQFVRPHQQQFQQHQQHQTRLIRQQVHQQQQQQVLPQQLPQQPVIPPLPYYIPTPLEASQQQFREQQEDLVARGTSSEERTQFENTIRRDERYRPQQYQYQQQHQPSQQVYQYQGHPYQQGQHQQYQTNQPYQYQQASNQYPQYAPQNATPLRRRRQPPAWRRIFNNFMGIGQNGSGGPNRRRGRRDVVESPKPLSSRQSKIAPVFKSDEGTALPTRQSKVSPEFTTTDVAGAKRKEEGPAPVKTLTKADLDNIRKKIAAINSDVLKNKNKNDTSSVTFQGRQYSGRQARFLDTLLNGWTAKSLLGVLDNLMDGYSFHPYTHAAYMGYTSRSGTCSSMYPRCPDSANDMLDLVNNIHRYFPAGLPFKDSIPWPLNLLIP